MRLFHALRSGQGTGRNAKSYVLGKRISDISRMYQYMPPFFLPSPASTVRNKINILKKETMRHAIRSEMIKNTNEATFNGSFAIGLDIYGSTVVGDAGEYHILVSKNNAYRYYCRNTSFRPPPAYFWKSTHGLYTGNHQQYVSPKQTNLITCQRGYRQYLYDNVRF